MITVPAGVRIYLAMGRTDMRNYVERVVMLSSGLVLHIVQCIINSLVCVTSFLSPHNSWLPLLP